MIVTALPFEDKLRKTEAETAEIEQVSKLATELGTKFAGTGVFGFNRKALEEIKTAGKKIELGMVGMLIIEKDVTPELVAQTFGKVRVYGMIKASEAVRQILSGLR